VTNTVTQATIVLRDSTGVPEWTGGRNRRGGSQGAAASRPGVGCVDASAITVITGTIEQVTMGAGIEMPALIVKASGGTLITMKIGPERILLEADFELREGDQVTAKYAHVTCTDENIALELTNAAGQTVVLRDDLGRPNWN
jgi:hypothetical protein